MIPAPDYTPKPKVVTWFRAYAAMMSLIGVALLLILLFALVRVQQMLPEAEIQAGMLACIGISLLAVHLPALCLPRKPGVWTYDLVVIGLGLSSCFVFFCIPLLIYWIKRETKQYFGRSD